MRVLILGGDGYLGWPTALHFSNAGHEVGVVDNFAKRQWELEEGVGPLLPISTLHRRVACWREATGKSIELYIGDLCNHRFIDQVIEQFHPEAIVHYGEQRSAPYSMIDRRHSVLDAEEQYRRHAQVVYAIREHVPECHLVKLGTMGEYGTPNIDIEEGFIEITHNGRTDTLPFPKQPGRSITCPRFTTRHNIQFACKIWGIRSTDLNQGVVYGIETDETMLDERLATRFDYDENLGHGAQPFLYRGGDWPSADGSRQGRPDPRLPEHPGHDAMYRNRDRETRQARRVPGLQPVHRAVLGEQLADKIVAAGKHAGLDVVDRTLAKSAHRARRALLQREAFQARRPRTGSELADRRGRGPDARRSACACRPRRPRRRQTEDQLGPALIFHVTLAPRSCDR